MHEPAPVHWTQRNTELSCEGSYLHGQRANCVGTATLNPAIPPIPNGEWAQHPYGNNSGKPFHLVLGTDFIIHDTDGILWHNQEENEIGPICQPCWDMQTSPQGTLRPHLLDGHRCNQCNDCTIDVVCAWHLKHGSRYAVSEKTPQP